MIKTWILIISIQNGIGMKNAENLSFETFKDFRTYESCNAAGKKIAKEILLISQRHKEKEGKSKINKGKNLIINTKCINIKQ